MFRKSFRVLTRRNQTIGQAFSIEQLEDRTAPAAGANFGFAFGIGNINTDIPPLSIVADAVGNSYVTGAFEAITDFDPGPGTVERDGGSGKSFVAKYSPVGDFIWVQIFGVRVPTAAPLVHRGIDLDSAGHVYIAGSFDGTVDFDPGPGTSNLTGPGVFVLKLTSGGDFVWAVKARGQFSETDLAVDGSGNAYVVNGERIFVNNQDGLRAILTKLDANGNAVFERVFGPPDASNPSGNQAIPLGVAPDSSGNVYVAGDFSGTIDFDPGPGVESRSSRGDAPDIFVAKFSSAGNFIWVGTMGGGEGDVANDVGLDSQGNVVLTGELGIGVEFREPYTVDFDPGPGDAFVRIGGAPAAFATKLNPNGGLIWRRVFSGAGKSLVIDPGDNIYIGGDRGSGDVDPGPDEFILQGDGFILKLDFKGKFVWARTFRGPAFLRDIALDSHGSIYAAGQYVGNGDFDPGPGIFELRTTGTCTSTGIRCRNGYVAKLTQRHDTTLTGTDSGTPTEVRQYDAVTGALLYKFFPYGSSFTGGVRVASGDVTGDGFSDIITIPGPGFGPLVKIFDGLTKRLLPHPLGQFYAYDSSKTAPGYHIAVGDVNMDGRADVITAPGPGLTPLVRVFNGRDRAVIHAFNAYEHFFTGGVHVAAGDVNGDGRADIITAPASNKGPLVRALNGINRSVLVEFNAYEADFTGGVWVAAGHFDQPGNEFSDGMAEIVTGPGSGRGSLVRVWSARLNPDTHEFEQNPTLVRSFDAYESTYTGGVRIATTDADDDDLVDIITAPGKGRPPRVAIFDGDTLAVIDEFFASDTSFRGGICVAGGRGR